jgi:hypothetical protein
MEDRLVVGRVAGSVTDGTTLDAGSVPAAVPAAAAASGNRSDAGCDGGQGSSDDDQVFELAFHDSVPFQEVLLFGCEKWFVVA